MVKLEDMIEDLSKDGESFENALKICTDAMIIGIQIEYLYLHQKFGQSQWRLLQQSLHEIKDKKYDVLDIALSDETRKKIYFDVTDCYGNY
jgi:hypothetical protein